MPLAYKKLEQIFFLDLVIITEYLAFVVIVVSSNPSGPSLRTRISLFLLSICIDKVLSTQKKSLNVHQIEYHNHSILMYQDQLY